MCALMHELYHRASFTSYLICLVEIEKYFMYRSNIGKGNCRFSVSCNSWLRISKQQVLI